MGSSRHSDSITRKSVPGYAKTVILLQWLIIAFLSLWAYEEYLNNQYFQQYVNDALRTNGQAYILLPSFILAILAVVAYSKMRTPSDRETEVRIGRTGPDRGSPERTPEIILSASNTFPPAPIATPALASAATRVLKRIALGEGSPEKPSKPLPVLETVEKRRDIVDNTRTQMVHPSLKRLETGQRSEERFFDENTSRTPARTGLGGLSTEGLPRRPPTGPGMIRLGEGFQARPRLQQNSHMFKRVETGQPPVASPPPATRGSVVTGVGQGQNSRHNPPPFQEPSMRQGQGGAGPVPQGIQGRRMQPPMPLKQVRVGRGPLDDPLPENTMTPVLRRSEPEQSGENRVPYQRPPPTPSQMGRSQFPARNLSSDNSPNPTRPREMTPRFEARQFPSPRPIIPASVIQGREVLQKPSTPSFLPVPGQVGRAGDNKQYSEKRPLIPDPAQQHQGHVENVSHKKIETVLKHLGSAKRPIDDTSVQSDTPTPQKIEAWQGVSPAGSVQKPPTVQRREELGEARVETRPERKGRPGLNRVVPLPGGADNAWARKLPRMPPQGEELAQDSADKQSAEKRPQVRRKSELGQEQKEKESE